MMLSIEETHYVSELYENKVLERIDEYRLEPAKVIAIICGDCADSHRIITRYKDIFNKVNGDDSVNQCFHLLTWNGGPAGLSGEEEYDFCLNNIKDAIRLKDTTTLALCLHAKCGKVVLDGKSIEESIEEMFRLKNFIKRKLNFLDIVCFVQLNVNEEYKNYFISCKNWIKYQFSKK